MPPGITPPWISAVGPQMGWQPMPQDFMQHMMASWMAQQMGDGTLVVDTLTGAGRASRRIHKLKSRPFVEPEAVIQEYLLETQRRLGVEAGDPWQLWQMTEKIAWQQLL